MPNKIQPSSDIPVNKAKYRAVTDKDLDALNVDDTNDDEYSDSPSDRSQPHHERVIFDEDYTAAPAETGSGEPTIDETVFNLEANEADARESGYIGTNGKAKR